MYVFLLSPFLVVVEVGFPHARQTGLACFRRMNSVLEDPRADAVMQDERMKDLMTKSRLGAGSEDLGYWLLLLLPVAKLFSKTRSKRRRMKRILTVLLAVLLLAILGASSTDAFVVHPHAAASAVGRDAAQVAASPTSRCRRTSSSSSSTQLHVFDFFKQTNKPGTAKVQTPKYESVTIDPDFRVAALFLGVGAVLDTIPYIQWTLGLFMTALGLLFLVQTLRIRFVFDETNALELKTVGGAEDLKSSGENVIVGGANRWDCDTIVNYDFFPKGWLEDNENPIGPILIYFKETQTPSDSWNEGPGKSANDPAKIAAGQAVAGQVHFFPAVANSEQMRAEFEKRGCGKILDA